MCPECYANENRITPLLNPLECLENHTQYICGTCGRCICIGMKRGLQRWNFPFKTLEIAKLYLRTADYTMKKSCGVYEIENSKGKVCKQMSPVFRVEQYRDYPDTEVRKLAMDEIRKYMSEREE